MSVEANFFAVKVNTLPFTYGKEKEVGCYSTSKVATKAASYIRNCFSSKVDGGIDCSITLYREKLLRTDAGLRLEATPNGELTIIGESWDVQELQRLTHRVQRELNIIPALRNIIDQPKRIYEGVYYCVVLTFAPFDRSHELYVGYYKTKKLAESVALFIANMHINQKVGSGFDTQIRSYQERCVEYDSGKSYIKVDNVDQEIKASFESEEHLRLIEKVDEAIKQFPY